MSRIALIYPKIAIFRSRKGIVAASSPISFNLIRNLQETTPNSILLAMSECSPQKLVPLLRNFSSQSASNNLRTVKDAPSEVIQRDLFELASKALTELVESKNSSALVIEVCGNY